MTARARVVWIVAAGALVGALALSHVFDGTVVLAQPVSSPPGPGMAIADHRWFDAEPYPAIGRAARNGDYRAIQDQLRPRLAADPNATLALGLIAHQLGEHGDAMTYLERAARPDGPLDDWRLLQLARSALAEDSSKLAERSLRTLIERYPYSVLRHEALLTSVEAAYETASTVDAFARIDIARAAGMSRERSQRLEKLAWEIASATDERDRMTDSAARLLSAFPLEASELGVVELFRETDGDLPWASFLSTAQLIERSRQLMAVDLVDSALSTLDEVAPDDRDRSWALVAAEARLRNREGVAALEILDGLESNRGEDAVEFTWLRARAALEAARVRRNRRNLDSAARSAHRRDAVQWLRLVGADRSRPERAEAALEALFGQLSDSEDESHEAVVAVLRELRRVAPRNQTGAVYLWKKGWAQFERRNDTGAIAYWAELGEIYPENSYSRSGRYWTARALIRLGDTERGERTLREVARIGVDDFYRRHANHLLEPVEPVARLAAREPWPTDLVLHRSEALNGMGLDEAALLELEELRSAADEGAYNALRGQVLASQGRHREGITHFYRAFRTLGTPFQERAPEQAWLGYYPLAHAEQVDAGSRKQNLSPYTVLGIIRQESAFDTRATSFAGARGLMQVMPATGKELARKLRLRYSVDRLYDPEFSVELGTSYFRQVLDMFDGQVELALAGYNNGPYRIKRLWNEAGSGREIDYFIENLQSETPKNYVKRILVFADSYERLYPQLGGS